MDKSNFNLKYARITNLMLKEASRKKCNPICSPLSLYTLLSLSLSATAGKTKEEIGEALGFGEDYDAILKKLPGFVKNENLLSSNGLCIKDIYHDALRSDFVQKAREDFALEIFKAGDDAVDKINDWVNQKTNKMIPELLDRLPENFSLCLMNALAFEAKWKKMYEEDDIYDDVFYGFEKEFETSFMQSREYHYIDSERFTGFIKDYEGDRYAFMALLPKGKGKTYMDNSLETLDIMKFYDDSIRCKVEAVIPEFVGESSFDLNDVVQGLGIKSIFGAEADFSPMIGDLPLSVDSFLQKTAIKVDRAGTKAAAATAIINVTGYIPFVEDIKHVTLDRPFVYALIDNDNEGLPVFVGIYEG